jgi:hypothetical protein
MFTSIKESWFKYAPIEFRILRDEADPERVHGSMRPHLHRWARAVSPERDGRRKHVLMHFAMLKSAVLSDRAKLLDGRANIRIDDWTPARTAFTFHTDLRWIRRRIVVTMVRVEFNPTVR